MKENNCVKSPCIYVCSLNHEDICEGCYRSSEEITQWSALSDDKKREVIAKARARFEADTNHILL